MNSNLWGLIIAAVLTSIFGLIIAGQNAKMSKKLKTNHGKTIGQHVEEAALQAQQANTNAQLVALQLERYKADQAAEAAAIKSALDRTDLTFKALLDAHTGDDARNFSELRALLIQGLSGNHPTE